MSKVFDISVRMSEAGDYITTPKTEHSVYEFVEGRGETLSESLQDLAEHLQELGE